MKLLTCPINGLRPVSEFYYWGEIRVMPDPARAATTNGRHYVFNRNGAPGTEKGMVVPHAQRAWFIAERDTLRDEVKRTYLPGHTSLREQGYECRGVALSRPLLANGSIVSEPFDSRSKERGPIPALRATPFRARSPRTGRALGRSFKYHRLRGILDAANHDVNVLVQIGQQLNVRADVVPLAQGMVVEAVNTRGGLRTDRRSLLDKLAPILPVGFYYKAFHRPKAGFPPGSASFVTRPAWVNSSSIRRTCARRSAMRSATCWLLARVAAGFPPRWRPRAPVRRWRGRRECASRRQCAV